jgi:hypothetical protein
MYLIQQKPVFPFNILVKVEIEAYNINVYYYRKPTYNKIFVVISGFVI